jgi:hypothetical protein
MSTIAKGILPAFFAAMQSGYANDAIGKITVETLPGSKVIKFQSGNFTVADCWFAPENVLHSSGFTVITYRGVPVWTMSYQGWYHADAIPCLKAALRSAYDQRKFFGGRGSAFFSYDSMAYVNHFDPQNDWLDFRGREEVFRLDSGVRLGCHEYHGQALLK